MNLYGGTWIYGRLWAEEQHQQLEEESMVSHPVLPDLSLCQIPTFEVDIPTDVPFQAIEGQYHENHAGILIHRLRLRTGLEKVSKYTIPITPDDVPAASSRLEGEPMHYIPSSPFTGHVHIEDERGERTDWMNWTKARGDESEDVCIVCRELSALQLLKSYYIKSHNAKGNIYTSWKIHQSTKLHQDNELNNSVYAKQPAVDQVQDVANKRKRETPSRMVSRGRSPPVSLLDRPNMTKGTAIQCHACHSPRFPTHTIALATAYAISSLRARSQTQDKHYADALTENNVVIIDKPSRPRLKPTITEDDHHGWITPHSHHRSKRHARKALREPRVHVRRNRFAALTEDLENLQSPATLQWKEHPLGSRFDDRLPERGSLDGVCGVRILEVRKKGDKSLKKKVNIPPFCPHGYIPSISGGMCHHRFGAQVDEQGEGMEAVDAFLNGDDMALFAEADDEDNDYHRSRSCAKCVVS